MHTAQSERKLPIGGDVQTTLTLATTWPESVHPLPKPNVTDNAHASQAN